MSLPNPSQPPPSQIPTQFRAISRNNSNTSTTSSSNKGDISSTISTANSVTSSRSQLSKHQLIDHKQLFATCGSSTPIRSFQRATISSVVKTRAFDNNPVLQGLLAASPSSQNSVSNSQTPSPQSTPLFSRSRSLRMSGGPQRYQQSPSHQYRTSSKTPDLCSFNSGDINNCSNESQARLIELNNEKSELKESLEFLECERQVLIDSAKELKETLQRERSHWKKEHEELKKQITDLIAARVKAESQLTRNEVDTNDVNLRMKRLEEEIMLKNRHLDMMRKDLEIARNENKDLNAINNELKHMMTEKLRYNGLTSACPAENANQQVSECISIVTEMARLRLELNEKDRIIERYSNNQKNSLTSESSTCQDIDSLNNFLDQTVECIKKWPEELAGSSHVQNLMKTLLSAYKVDHDELTLKMQNFHL